MFGHFSDKAFVIRNLKSFLNINFKMDLDLECVFLFLFSLLIVANLLDKAFNDIMK